MAVKYNPPPTWPPPPAGWTPPPGWQPDPAWGPPPEGWQLWTKVRANPAAWRWSFLSALAYYVLLIAALAIGLGGVDAEVAGELLVSFLLGGAVVGLIAWLMPGRWPRWLYPIVVFVAVFLFRLVSVLGQMSTTTQSPG